jgi:hypothetical protein
MVGRKKIGTAVNAACRENFSCASLGTRAIGSEAVSWKLVLKHAQSVSPLRARVHVFDPYRTGVRIIEQVISIRTFIYETENSLNRTVTNIQQF